MIKPITMMARTMAIVIIVMFDLPFALFSVGLVSINHGFNAKVIINSALVF
jgi:hypothetical protein